MKTEFKKGDIVWCTKKRIYSVTDYHIPCVVGEVYACDMDVCPLNDENTPNEFVFRVDKCNFEKCEFEKCSKKFAIPDEPTEKSDSYSINFKNLKSGEIQLPAKYEYQMTKNDDGSICLKFSPVDNTEKIEKWKKETWEKFIEYIRTPIGKAHHIQTVCTDKYTVAVGKFGTFIVSKTASWNPKDKWDMQLGTCIAVSRLLKWDIPDYVLGKYYFPFHSSLLQTTYPY